MEPKILLHEPAKESPESKTNYGYFYGLAGFKYRDLANYYSAAVSVVDVDDSALKPEQIQSLQAQGRILFSYLSIGEAESYRDYWQESWKQNKPDFLLNENQNWAGNYRVKFWNANWQKIILDKAVKIAKMGFNGAYLDIVDGFTVESVQRAYPGSKADLRQEMENFVIRISNATKAINPNFKVIPQNAAQLAADPQQAGRPNENYLRAIDGIGIEDLWYSDNRISDWTKWDVANLKLAQAQGKFILATSYPTDSIKQKNFIQNALKEGFIPFIGKRSLAKKSGVAKVNREIPARLPQGWKSHLR